MFCDLEGNRPGKMFCLYSTQRENVMTVSFVLAVLSMIQ